MSDLERVMALTGQGGEYQVDIDGNWCVWSPAGGYLMALVLRAAGLETAFSTPLALTCHFLGAPKLAEAQLTVGSLRRTRVAESMHVLTGLAARFRGRVVGLQADQRRRGGFFHQQVAPHQALVRCLVIRRHPALVGEGHPDLVPGQ